MANAREGALAAIRQVGIIPIIQALDAESALGVADALVDAGLSVIEVTLSVPNAIQVVTTLVRSHGDRVLVGVGTITDVANAKRAIAAGARFIVTPCLIPEVVEAAATGAVAVLPGALTPTEIFAAHQMGGDMIKVFPIGSLGAAYIRSVRGPFPNIPLVPTGGVTLENVGELFAAGAAAVGVGSELISRDAVSRRDYASIGVMARKFLAARRVVSTESVFTTDDAPLA